MKGYLHACRALSLAARRPSGLAISLLALFAQPTIAQQPAETLPGFKANNVFESHGIDHINLFNGDPGIVLPLGPGYPLGPGNSWQLKAYYSAKFWHLDNSCAADPTGGVRHAVIAGYPTLGAGWTLELGYVNDTQGFVFYHSSDGGRHQFGSNGRSNVTMDGSHLRVTTFSAGTQVDHYTVELPNGNVHTFAHRYLGPTPVSGNSYDFTDYTDWGINTDRFGLTSIRDSFGSTLLTVDYAASYPDRNAWRVSQINLTPSTPQARTIAYNWGTKQIGTIDSVTWDVVNSIDFPVTGGQTLNVAFAFDTPGGSGASPTFWRNSYDNSISVARCQNAGNAVFVPLLDAVTFSGPSISSLGYNFAYILDNPDGDPGYHYRDGVLRYIQLPTGGQIDYTYSQTGGSCFESGGGCEDPEIGIDPGQARPAPLTPDQQDFTRFWDSSAAVISRTETDPVSGAPPATAYYSRYQFVPGGIYPYPIDDIGIARRTIVTEPAGNGSPSYATRYLFHVDVTSAVFASGIELERRYYSGPNAFGTPLRTLVNCYEDDLGTTGQCGYRDSSGLIQGYTLTDNTRQQRQETWYGVNPTQGGTCPTGSTPCTAGVSSEYVVAAGKYKATTVTSTLQPMPGWISRVSRTEWIPQTGSVWLLDLFTGKSVTDNGSSLPAPSSVSTTYNFNLGNGFLNGTTTIDSYGSLTESFSNDGQWNPASETRSGTGGVSTTQFTDNRMFQSGLVLTSQRSGIGWKSFDVDRDARTGTITLSRDPNYSTVDAGHQALQTIYGHDPLDRLTSITPQWGEAGISINYDTPNRTTVTRSGSDGNSTWQQYFYDGFGRLTREIRGLPGGYATRTHAYDQPGHAYFVSEWGSCSDPSTCPFVSPLGTTGSSFDPFGRPTTITRADGSQTTVDRTDGTIAFSDSLESVTVSVAGYPATTLTRRDALGRIVTVTEPLVNGVADQTSYQYDALDKLAVVTQDSQQRNFVYDSFGFLRSETTPEQGLLSYASYDALGDVLSETLPGTLPGITISRSYDLAGRVTLVTTSESGSPTYLSNSYDQNPSINFSLGKLTTRIGSNPGIAGSPGVSDVFVYNGSGGQLSAQSTTVSGLTANQSWFYNSLGLISHHYHPRPSGLTPFVVSTSYSQGLPTAQYVNGIPVVMNVAYLPWGALASYTTGIGTGGNVTTTITPELSGIPRPQEIAAGPSGSLLDLGPYVYDGAGNITRIGPVAGPADTFVYDARSRLTFATLANLGTQAYPYDRYGNLLSKAGDTFCSGTCINNQISGANYVRGDLTSYNGQTFTYDALDRLASSTQSSLTWSYLYDGAGERVAKSNPSTGIWSYTFRDESKRVASEFSVTTPARDNVFLGNQLVVSYANLSVGGNTRAWTFYSSDHLGTPRLVTDITGGSLETRKYWPYGEAVPTQGSFQALRFATMEFDAEGGTGPGLASDRYYDHARSHAGGLGRFLSVDRSGGDVLDPQSLNGYTYALNNPLKYIDPSGRIPALAVAVALGAGVVEGGFRAADFALSRSNATTGDYIREFGIGFVSGTSAAAVGILTALGTANPFIIGAAVGETDALVTQVAEIATDQRSSLDPVDVALKTGAGAVLGKTTDVLVPRLPGRVPHYFRNRSFGDLIVRPNVNRELRQGIAGAFLGSRGFQTVDILRGAGGPSGVYGLGYLNFQLFLYQYNTEVAGSGSAPGGSVTTCSSFSLSPGGTSPCPR